MIVELLAVADHASVTKEDKLNILGIFSEINATELPARHLIMAVVFQVIASANETGTTHEMSIALLDPDGVELQAVNGEVEIPSGLSDVRLNGIINLSGLVFEKEGRHEVALLIHGERARSVSFIVHKIRPKANA